MSAMWKKLQRENPKGTNQQNKQASPVAIQKPQLNKQLIKYEKQRFALQQSEKEDKTRHFKGQPTQDNLKFNPQFIAHPSSSQNHESKHDYKSSKSQCHEVGIHNRAQMNKEKQSDINFSKGIQENIYEWKQEKKKYLEDKKSSNTQKIFQEEEIKYDDFVDEMRQLGIQIYQDSSFSNSKANLAFQVKVVKKFRNALEAIKNQLRQIYVTKQQIIREIFRFQKKFKQLQSQWQSGLILFITKLYEKKAKEAKVLSKNENNKVVQQLRYQILDMKTNILQKEITITKLSEELRENKIKVQQLTESIFDANQKLAQNQLRFQQQITQFIEHFKSQSKDILSEEGHGQNAEEEIRRLNLQVEQLTKLYEQSQEENRKKEEREKIVLVQEKQKMKQRINFLQERQQALLQQEKNIEKAEMVLREEQEILVKKKIELDNIKHLLNQKIRKIQLLEEQLEQQYYSDSGREEKNYEGAHKIQQLQSHNEQLQKQVTLLKKRLQRFQRQSDEYGKSNPKFQNFRSSNLSYQQHSQNAADQSKLKGFPKFQSLQMMNQEKGKRRIIDSINSITYLNPYVSDEAYKSGNNDIYQSVRLNRSRSQEKKREEQIHLTNYNTQLKDFRKSNLSKGRDRPKLMSQMISSPLKRSSLGPNIPIKVKNKGMKLNQFKERLNKIENKEKHTKKLAQNKNYNKKLDELGSKIETLRFELRKQITESKIV